MRIEGSFAVRTRTFLTWYSIAHLRFRFSRPETLSRIGSSLTLGGYVLTRWLASGICQRMRHKNGPQQGPISVTLNPKRSTLAAPTRSTAVHASLEGRSGASTDVISDSAWLANLHDRSWSFTEVSSYCPPVCRADGADVRGPAANETRLHRAADRHRLTEVGDVHPRSSSSTAVHDRSLSAGGHACEVAARSDTIEPMPETCREPWRTGPPELPC